MRSFDFISCAPDCRCRVPVSRCLLITRIYSEKCQNLLKNANWGNFSFALAFGNFWPSPNLHLRRSEGFACSRCQSRICGHVAFTTTQRLSAWYDSGSQYSRDRSRSHNSMYQLLRTVFDVVLTFLPLDLIDRQVFIVVDIERKKCACPTRQRA